MHHVRRAEVSDVCSVSMIHHRCWSECYKFMPPHVLEARGPSFRQTQWARLLSAPRPWLYSIAVLTHDQEIVGFSIIKPNEDPDLLGAAYELHAMYILPGHRGGVGGPKLLRWMLDDLGLGGDDRFSVWVFCENPMRFAYFAAGMTIEVRRDRVIEGERVPELGLLSPPVSKVRAVLDRLIRRAGAEGGAAETRLHSKYRYDRISEYSRRCR